ncbi:MAG: cache domain-containing protein, partial [Bdellovibrio sp.]|nr:cache domain-containing protein [Bdellovibrio sp.]
MTIKSRILLFTAVLVIGAMLAAGMMGYKMGSSSLEKGYAERLTQIRLNRAQALQADFESLGNYLLVASEMTRIREALKNLFSSEEELNAYIANQSETPWLKEVSDYHGTNLGEEVEHTIIPRLPKTSLFLQAQFLHQAKIKETEPRNIVNIKELENLKYFKAHSEIHPFFIDYADRFQISDVYLIDKSGRIIYSLNKGLNYGTNLNTGIFASTRLTDVFHWSLGAQPRTYKLFDFMPMAPFMPQQVAFMATPIFDNSSYLGVVVFQISLDRIDRIISDDHQWNKNGLRETGEVIAFGPDGLMRNNSRLYYEHPAEFENIVKKLGASGQILVNTKEAGTTAMQVATPPERIRHHLHSEDITEVGPDYLNVPVLRSIG